jgi:hypothetical protein
VRKRLHHLSGGNLAAALLYKNFTNGTCLLMRRETAQAAIPFVECMIADHWLTLTAALRGVIAYVPEPLVEYRLHGGNQSAVLQGVRNKDSYLTRRILSGVERFSEFRSRLSDRPELAPALAEGSEWFGARAEWFIKRDYSAARSIWRLRRLGEAVSVFELLCARLPQPLFMLAVKAVQKGLL